MSVYDLRSEQEWQAILDEIEGRFGMPAALLDEKNVILQKSGSRNPLCTAIRGNAQSKSYICGQTQQFMAKQAWASGEPMVDVCEGGLVKFVLPLGTADQPIGSVTACGSCTSVEDVEDEMIQMNLPIGDDELSALKAQVPVVDVEKLRIFVKDLFRVVRKV